MNLEFLKEVAVPTVVGICVVVGYITKKWVKDVDNKYIPTICTALGVAVCLWLNAWNMTPEVMLQGAVSGLASTGLHQLVAQYLNKTDE
ncbi:MAG: phage holin family protein [Eubacteriales bacterium]